MEEYITSTANKGWSMVNYHQSLAFFHPYYHVMIIVTGDFSKKSFYYYYFYFVEILLNDLELVFWELLNILNSFLFLA